MTTAAPRRHHRSPARRALRADAGFSLVEILVTLLVTGVVMLLVLPFVIATTTSSDTASSLASATSAARVALQDIEVAVGSASQICLPTTGSGGSVGTPSLTCPTGGAGGAVRVLTDAFDTEKWVQWQVSGSTLEEQSWPDTSPVAAGPWETVATSVTSATPFSCTVTSGSPVRLGVDLSIGGTAGNGSGVSVSSTVTALDTSTTASC